MLRDTPPVRDRNILDRRTVLLRGAAAGAALLGLEGCARRSASEAPCPQVAGGVIRWIVPHSVGGGYDTESRRIAPFLEKRLGARIAVENLPGAGGIAGARAIRGARGDGRTIGILNAPGLLIASLTGETGAPNPAEDFRILGRVGRSAHVWATGPESPFRGIEDVIAESGKRPVVFAINEVGSANFVNISVSSLLLGVRSELVAGFSGMRNATLAAMRGEVDMVCFNFETIVSLIEAGELRPLLQISTAPISPHPSLDGVPLLGGEAGWAVRRAAATGRSEDSASETAAVLSELTRSGRVIVAPPGLPEDLFRCLERELHSVLASPEFQANADISLDVAAADEARADIRAAAGKADLLVPFVRDAIQRLRQ